MRTNPIKNPSFELNTTGYWAGTRVTSEAYVGSASLQLTAGALNTRLTGYGANSNATANADAIPVSPNEVITFSAFVKAASSPGPSIRLKIHWFNASGAWISDSDSAAVTIGTTWTRLSITGLAPTNAAKFGVVIFDWFGGTGGTIYTDGWLAERSPFADTYFDGSTTGVTGYTHAWTGTAHASSSTATSTGTRTNLLPNPSFETNTTGWNLVSTGGVSSGTATAGNPFAYSGTKYGNGTGPWISDKLPATAGLAYTASAWWSRSTGARNGGVFLHFYDAANVELSPPTTSEAAINQADVPQRFASSRIAPAGTTQVAVRLQATSITAVDAVLLEQSPYLDTYFDGGTKSATYTHAWTGTAHASTSTQAPPAGIRYNLVTNPSWEVDNSGWAAGSNRSNIITTSAAVAGGWYSHFSLAGAGLAIKSNKYPATEGLAYTASAWFNKSTTAARSAAVSVHFYDASNVELSPPTVTLTDIATINVPERRSDINRLAPAGTTQIEVWLHSSVASSNVQVDAVLLEQSTTLGDYFDGGWAPPGCATSWLGTPHSSPSMLATATADAVRVKAYESGGWNPRAAVPRYRSNGVWKIGNPKRWNGTAWVDLN